MIRYEYKIVDSNSEEHTVIASGMNIVEGHTCFYGAETRILHIFYHPIQVLCFGEQDEKTT